MMIGFTEIQNEIMITGGFEGQTVIDVPDEIEDARVTSVNTYAFADRTDIREVILPKSMTHIGAHAFYNCRNLALIELHDGIRDIDDGAFKNCYRLEKIIMHSHDGREGCIRNLMDDNTQELSLEIHYDDGQSSLLTFPVFEDDYVENTPARIFQAVSYGTGGAYRQCMQSGSIDYREFDELFPRSVRADRFQAALNNSIGRLSHPYRLFNSAKEIYARFLKDNAEKAAIFLMEKGDVDSIKTMCSVSAFDKDEIDRLLDAAAQNDLPEAVGILMNYRTEHFKIHRRNYEL